MCVWGHELISQLVNTNYAKDLYITYLDDFAAFLLVKKVFFGVLVSTLRSAVLSSTHTCHCMLTPNTFELTL